jgi:hypothetical protein
MYNDDTPELELPTTFEEVMIEDLKSKILLNSKRLKDKVDVKGNPLTTAQLENLDEVIRLQSTIIEKLKQKKKKKEKI